MKLNHQEKLNNILKMKVTVCIKRRMNILNISVLLQSKNIEVSCLSMLIFLIK